LLLDPFIFENILNKTITSKSGKKIKAKPGARARNLLRELVRLSIDDMIAQDDLASEASEQRS
jgi:hypothetical protein